VGHSLGAGTAALVAMLVHNNEEARPFSRPLLAFARAPVQVTIAPLLQPPLSLLAAAPNMAPLFCLSEQVCQADPVSRKCVCLQVMEKLGRPEVVCTAFATPPVVTKVCP